MIFIDLKQKIEMYSINTFMKKKIFLSLIKLSAIDDIFDINESI